MRRPIPLLAAAGALAVAVLVPLLAPHPHTAAALVPQQHPFSHCP